MYIFLVIKQKHKHDSLLVVLGIEALTCLTVFLFHNATAIASIPATSTVIVVVITERIACICWFGTLAKTFAAGLVGIQTLAFLAEFLHHRFATTITPIPVTAARVIDVITVTVALPNRFLTCFLSWTFLEIAIFAFTLLAQFVILSCTAAVAPVPSTPSIVVLIVTCLVAFPNWLGAGPFNLSLFHTPIALSCAVEARTLFAVLHIPFGSAAIASIPCTTSAIVSIIAESIALVLWFLASFFDNFDAFIPGTFVRTISTLTFFAVAVIVLITTTISSVPIASGVVIHVVTVLVTFPIRFLAFSLNFCSALVGRCFISTIQAFALLAILVSVDRSTTITTIPLTAGIVVIVVAKLVALV